MKRFSLTLLVTTLFFSSLSANDKLKIEINKNVELLGLAYFIGFEGQDIESKTVEIAGKQIPKKDWHNYGFMVFEKYKQYAASEHLAKSFSVADHLWLDYLIGFLLQLEDAPNAKLLESIDQSYYLNFSKSKDIGEARQNVVTFLDGFNAFYQEVNFDQYLEDSEKFYEKAIAEIRTSLPKQDFITSMEKFYKTQFDSYHLIPSLTIPKGMGFASKFSLDGKTKVFNIFGALDFQSFDDASNLKMGFDNKQRLRELSIHEFGHSFVNPIIDRLPVSSFENTERLFEPIKTRMGDQGYNTWKACVYEHFVRAGEILISGQLGDKDGTKKLREEYEQDRMFIYIPLIFAELRKFEKDKHKTYFDAVKAAMENLAKQ